MKLCLYCEIKSQENPLEKTLEICSNTLFENTERNEDLSKLEFKELLSSATKVSSFMFNEKLFNQVDGVAMASPFGLTLAIPCHVYLQPFPSALSLISTGGMLMISLFCLLHQNIKKLSEIF